MRYKHFLSLSQLPPFHTNTSFIFVSDFQFGRITIAFAVIFLVAFVVCCALMAFLGMKNWKSSFISDFAVCARRMRWTMLHRLFSVFSGSSAGAGLCPFNFNADIELHCERPCLSWWMNDSERVYLFDVVVSVFVWGAVNTHSHAVGYPCSVALVVVDGRAATAAAIQLNKFDRVFCEIFDAEWRPHVFVFSWVMDLKLSVLLSRALTGRHQTSASRFQCFKHNGFRCRCFCYFLLCYFPKNPSK